MAGDESFLSRWARLKRETAERSAEPEQSFATPDDARVATVSRDQPNVEAASSTVESRDAAETFDPTSLPSVETIDAASDVSAFLARGVPAELTKAALRRAWAADPAIRDFVGLSENAWDFTAPDGVPGFGPLGPADDARQLLAQMMDRQGPGPAPEPSSVAAANRGPSAATGLESPPHADSAKTLGGATPQEGAHEVVKSENDAAPAKLTSRVRQSEEIDNKNEDVAAQNANKSPELGTQIRSHPHGGALPK